jgi:hypothetical protein
MFIGAKNELHLFFFTVIPVLSLNIIHRDVKPQNFMCAALLISFYLPSEASVPVDTVAGIISMLTVECFG